MRSSIESPSVIYEDNHLLVINKPPLLATMGARPGQPSVYELAANYLKTKYQKPGNVFVGIVSRLDALASGVLVVARTSKAARRLSEQIRQRTTTKNYLAIVQGIVPPAESNQTLVHFLKKQESEQRMKLCLPDTPGAQKAVLTYRCLEAFSKYSLISVQLETGRKHQIRLQMSALGFPIAGDRKYGSTQGWSAGIALHCLSYTLRHPTRQSLMCFSAEPTHWRRILQAENYSKVQRSISAELSQNQMESM